MERAPEGFITEKALARELRTKWKFIHAISERYRDEHPDWFNQYLNGLNQSREFFTPELAVIIREEYSGHIAPKSWLMGRVVAKQFDRKPAYFKITAERYRKDHPEWFGLYRSRAQGGYSEYWSPELVTIVSEEDKRRRHFTGSNEWFRPIALAKQLKRAHGTIRSMGKKLAENHPEWIKVSPSQKGKQTIFYSAQLAAQIAEEVSRFVPPPEGWMTKNALSRQEGLRGKSWDWTVRLANRYRDQHPEWFETYLDAATNMPFEHYSPELVALLTSEVKYSPAPEGWMNRYAVVKQLRVAQNPRLNYKYVQSAADRFRSQHPEWFGMYLDKSRKPVEHFSPQLIVEIKRLVESQKTATITSEEADQELRKLMQE